MNRGLRSIFILAACAAAIVTDVGGLALADEPVPPIEVELEIDETEAGLVATLTISNSTAVKLDVGVVLFEGESAKARYSDSPNWRQLCDGSLKSGPVISIVGTLRKCWSIR